MGNRPRVRKAIWIAWENQVRNRSMARLLSSNLYVLNRSGNRPNRYAYCVFWSLMAILRERPDVVFVQNPSLILNYLMLALRPIFRFRWVSDAHFAGVVANNGSSLMQALIDCCNRRADLVIVTNENHADHVKSLGGRPYVCEDPLPELPEDVLDLDEDMDRSIFLICSFEVDEPYLQVFSAAGILQEEGCKLYVSGNYRNVSIKPDDYPHVTFLGYVPYDRYVSYLTQSSVVVDLTTCEDLLLCGAYEAMAAGRPLVTSNTEALRTYFSHGVIYTNEEPANIAAAIRMAYEDRVRLCAEISAWKAMAVPENARKISTLRSLCDE